MRDLGSRSPCRNQDRRCQCDSVHRLRKCSRNRPPRAIDVAATDVDCVPSRDRAAERKRATDELDCAVIGAIRRHERHRRPTLPRRDIHIGLRAGDGASAVVPVIDLSADRHHLGFAGPLDIGGHIQGIRSIGKEIRRSRDLGRVEQGPHVRLNQGIVARTRRIEPIEAAADLERIARDPQLAIRPVVGRARRRIESDRLLRGIAVVGRQFPPQRRQLRRVRRRRVCVPPRPQHQVAIAVQRDEDASRIERRGVCVPGRPLVGKQAPDEPLHRLRFALGHGEGTLISLVTGIIAGTAPMKPAVAIEIDTKVCAVAPTVGGVGVLAPVRPRLPGLVPDVPIGICAHQDLDAVMIEQPRQVRGPPIASQHGLDKGHRHLRRDQLPPVDIGHQEEDGFVEPCRLVGQA